MSFDHKAFIFDWANFTQELLPIMTRALNEFAPEGLRAFIVENASACRNPYTGAPLSANWESALEVGDVQELGDFALTKYYNPSDDFGLGEEWPDVEKQLPEPARGALLGVALPLFDPGRQGSYFQTPAQVTHSASLIDPGVAPCLGAYRSFLCQAANNRCGVYVTF